SQSWASWAQPFMAAPSLSFAAPAGYVSSGAGALPEGEPYSTLDRPHPPLLAGEGRVGAAPRGRLSQTVCGTKMPSFRPFASLSDHLIHEASCGSSGRAYLQIPCAGRTTRSIHANLNRACCLVYSFAAACGL